MLDYFDCMMLKSAARSSTKADREKMIDVICALSELMHVARREGLLALEERNSQIQEDESIFSFIKEAIFLVVDGTDPELLKDIMGTKVLRSEPETVEQYMKYAALKVVLMIQEGINPFIIDKMMEALFPSDVHYAASVIFSERENKERDVRYKEYLENFDERFPIVARNVFIVTFNRKILSMNDKQIQRALREIDNNDLSLLLAFVPKETREKFFSNISANLKRMLIESMQFISTYDEVRLTGTIEKVLNIITRLEDAGEM